MATSGTVQMYDSGVMLTFNISDINGPVNLSGTNVTVTLWMQKPDRSLIQRPCLLMNASQGIVQYTSTDADFDQAGLWKLQLVVQLAIGDIRHSTITRLTVNKNLPT